MKRLILCLLFVAACSRETVTTSDPSTDAYPQPTATTSDPVTTPYTATDTTTIATNTAPVTATPPTSTAMPLPPNPVPSIVRQPPAVDMSSVPTTAAPRVSLAEAQQKLASGEAVLVDVRLAAAFNQDHARGAINVPATEVANHLAQLPRDKMLITYCT